MIHYKIYQDKRKTIKRKGYWYARAVVVQTYDLEKLAEYMSAHNTPYSKGAIAGVLTDMVACIRELVLEGVAVKIPDLAIFSAGIRSQGVEKLEDFTPTRDIYQPHLRARASGSLMTARLKHSVRLREYDKYDQSLKDSRKGNKKGKHPASGATPSGPEPGESTATSEGGHA